MSRWSNSNHSEYRTANSTVWIFLGDLMAGMLGLFVLLFVEAMIFQLDLATTLRKERALLAAEQERRAVLEKALSDPLADGRITLEDGRIGISGSLLFDLNSAQLQPEGRELINILAKPLADYVQQNTNQLIMVSGFTDDQPFLREARRFQDNWQLSSERALTVSRALMFAGVPAQSVFAAAFGPEHPIVPNTDPDNRARNRRVEIAPVPKLSKKSDSARTNKSSANNSRGSSQ